MSQPDLGLVASSSLDLSSPLQSLGPLSVQQQREVLSGVYGSQQQGRQVQGYGSGNLGQQQGFGQFGQQQGLGPLDFTLPIGGQYQQPYSSYGYGAQTQNPYCKYPFHELCCRFLSLFPFSSKSLWVDFDFDRSRIDQEENMRKQLKNE